jgi:hypothetical protein
MAGTTCFRRDAPARPDGDSSEDVRDLSLDLLRFAAGTNSLPKSPTISPTWKEL